MTATPHASIAVQSGDDLTPLRRRLRRVAGQVDGIERMLAEERSCEQVLIQLAAVQGALRAVGQHVLACHLADALGAVSAGALPAVAAAEEAAYLAGLLAGVSSPRSGAIPAGPRTLDEATTWDGLAEVEHMVSIAVPDRATAPAGTTAVLEASGIEKTYRRGMWPAQRHHPVLRGADLTLRPGEVVGLAGENGSGKSTLMKILVGALAPDAGTVVHSGRMGYCPQEPVVYERLTCDEHFELFGRAYRMTPEAERRSRRALYAALGFERYATTRADQLSGGTLAKLNLGLALLADPEVLLLDEPYAGFDWDIYLKFWQLVAERRKTGRAVLIISHFVADEDRFDRIVDLREGKTAPR